MYNCSHFKAQMYYYMTLGGHQWSLCCRTHREECLWLWLWLWRVCNAWSWSVHLRRRDRSYWVPGGEAGEAETKAPISCWRWWENAAVFVLIYVWVLVTSNSHLSSFSKACLAVLQLLPTWKPCLWHLQSAGVVAPGLWALVEKETLVRSFSTSPAMLTTPAQWRRRCQSLWKTS